MNVDSEAFAHLDLMCEQLETHAKAFFQAPDKVDLQTLHDDLSRIRNMLVVLEKPSSQYAVEELQLLLEDISSQNALDVTHRRVLRNAVNQIRFHISGLCNDVSRDNALALIPLLNDCRALRNRTLISDVIMLSAGTDLLAIADPNVTEEQWKEERGIWKATVNANKAIFSQAVLQWRDGSNADAPGNIVEQMNHFAEICHAHPSLGNLAGLYESASQVIRAVDSGLIDDGPAIGSLFMLLDQHLDASTRITTVNDLVPHDILRNFLYYVAQIDSDDVIALELRRRYQLDGVQPHSDGGRGSNHANAAMSFQLTNAIRKSITRESESLRTWLDEPEKPLDRAKTARLKVRLGQLEPVLKLLGATEAHLCLDTTITQINFLSQGVKPRAIDCRKLARSLVELDRLLDEKARQTIVQVQSDPDGKVDAAKVFRDISIDACLLAARYDIQNTASQLLPSIRLQRYDTLAGVRLAAQLASVDAALDIIPLPDLKPLFSLLVSAVYRLSCQSVLTQNQAPVSAPRQSQDEAEQAHVICDLLRTVFQGIDSYILCVQQPQQSADQFLPEAEVALRKLHELLGKIYKDTEGSGDSNRHETSQLDAYLDSDDSDNGFVTDANVQSVFRHDCFSHLQTLDDCVKNALKPHGDRAAHLPNEQMLRALHWLTNSAQTIGATSLIDMVQPLQRAALAYQREEIYFDAEQTCCTSALLKVLREHFDTIIDIARTEENLPALREKLTSFQAAISAKVGESALLIKSEADANRQDLSLGSISDSEHQDQTKSEMINAGSPASTPVAVVVDDSGAVRRSAGRILEKWGFDVAYGRSGFSALVDAPAQGNILFVNLQLLLDDKSGLSQKIKESTGLTIFALSATASDEARQQSNDFGAACLLVKPFSEAEFQSAIEAAGLPLPTSSIA